jgi:RNA polymerase sigma-70 factor (ECF subfamily)
VSGAGEVDGERLLAGAVAGEEWALTVLYRRHQPALVRFLSGLAGPEAEDLAAEAWIDAARALSSFEGDEGAFRSLLFTIARRRAVDHARARSRRRTEPTDPDRLPEPGAGSSVTGSDPAELAIDSDSAEAAARRIAALLPREQAEVILLRVVAGLSVAETAAVVGRSPAAVSVLQSRGLQRLARRLGDPGGRATGERAVSPQVTGLFPAKGEILQDPDHGERWNS